MDSFLSNLKNKVKYNLHQAVTDPDANEFAANQPESPPSSTEKVEEDEDYFKLPSTDDPNTFDFNRLIIKIGNHGVRMIKKGFYPCLVIILSMYVANELIVYTWPIRLIFFILTFWICYYFMPFLILLIGYYLCKSGYQYYLNNLSDGPKTKIMPTIFALLPLTTDIPVSSLGSFFMYPFTYPKNDKDAKKLPIIMNNYMESLKKSFVYFDKIKNLPFVAEGMKRLEANIEHLHDVPVKLEPVPGPTTESAPSTTSLPATIKLPRQQSSTTPQNNKGPSPLPATVESTTTPPQNNKGPSPLPATVESTTSPQNNKGPSPLPATVESTTSPQNNKGPSPLPATVESTTSPQNNKGNVSLPPTVKSTTSPQNNKGNVSLPPTVKSSPPNK